MTLRWGTVLCALAAVGCGDDGPTGEMGSTEIVCGTGTSGALATGASVEVAGDEAKDLAGARVAAEAKTTLPAGEVTIACAEADIAPAGYKALGPAVSFGPAGTWSDRPFLVTLPFKAARLPTGAGPRHVEIVARRHLGDGTPFFPPVANRSVDATDPYASRIRFRAGELVTYQAVVADGAGQPAPHRFTYRGIVGVSMGGNAALSIGLRNHARFDFIGDLGGEPGPSIKYTLHMIGEFLYGGFCTVEDEAAQRGDVGELCLDRRRPAFADQFERASDFDHMLYEPGDGTGLTLKRNLYMKGSRDLARAFGNPALYNPDDPYLPPGVPASYLTAPDRCASPVVLSGFHDREYNPDGTLPVITFCDGGDSPALGLGVLDPSLPQTNPWEILLAVDVNGNGVRDPGEPIVYDPYEPFEDIGSDGVPNADETGPLGNFDADTNPDPAGDDFHYLRNPLGTEGNFDRDDGEPYEDVGLDGVAETCQLPGEGCYDFGEGDGEWTVSPNILRWYDSDVEELLARLDPAERARIHFWADAGIRDFLNAAVSANIGASVLASKFRLDQGVYDGFAGLTGAVADELYDFAQVKWEDLPVNGYVRYGDPDASQAKIESGDGRHAGTPLQLVNRVTSSFAWMNAQWPGGDRKIATAGQIIEGLSFVPPTTGRETPFGLFLPPGYDAPEYADATYPVVYLLHGYGMDPNDLVLISAVFENYMSNTDWVEEDRFMKMIIVYVDGRCRPEADGVPVEPDGDGCEQGTFYMDTPLGGPAQMETNLLELMDYIDANYRTRPAETVDLIE